MARLGYNVRGMKTLFDRAVLSELQERVGRLSADSKREWGTMSPAQAMEHCARALDVAVGRDAMKQVLIGKLISRFVKKKFIGEAPMPLNSPTAPSFVVKEECDLEASRKRLSELMTVFHQRSEAGADGVVHGFFGPLSGKEWGELQYNHVDHHLRQFGV